MTALELLTDLRARGVKLWADGARLRFSAPRDTIDATCTELLARHKAELIELLTLPGDYEAPPRRGSEQHRGSLLETQISALASLRDRDAQAQQHPYTRCVAPCRGLLYQRLGMDKVFVRGEGCYLLDEEGTRYADFVAQFGAVPFGHDPEPIWRALELSRQESQPNLVIGSIPAAAGELARQLVAIAPDGLDHVVFANSGAEAVEAAIKLARCRTGRLGILAAHNGFHGLTLASMSATDKEFFQRGFGAPVAGFNYVPFGDLGALETTLKLRPSFFAAFIIEIIQGESGIHVAPAGYLAAARALCRRFGTLLIVDEAQTGLGRTGHLFACEAEGVSPDILVLAKALGGGLMPIGACLYRASVYTADFDLRHGSTFAGNTLACRAALAAINELIKDDRRLVREVAALGERLLDQLRQLQAEYPMLVRDIRGRGLMLGLELGLEHIASTQGGMLAILQQQGMLLHLVASFLLNSERVRIAASFIEGAVLRIEPPLIADAALCEHLVNALKRLLSILKRGDAGELLAHFMDRPASHPINQEIGAESDLPCVVRAPWREDEPCDGMRFAFVVHLLGIEDLRRFDPSLARFCDADLEGMKSRIAEFIKPFPIDALAVRSLDGRVAQGEMIMLPHLPAELLALPGAEAVDLVQSAVDLAAERGAGVIGLGGFSSIIADGGIALKRREGVSLTSGNSLTAWAAIRAVESACAKHGLSLPACTVAVVGATGAIGRALALLCAERAGELILVGNPRATEASVGKLRQVAHDCRRHVAADADSGARLTTTTDIDRHLPRAHIVLTATNAVVPFISSSHLREGALVCDVARPFNVSRDLAGQRPDLRLVSGGLVRAPEGSQLGQLEERDQRNVLVACAAETIILALSRYRAAQLCGPLNLATIREMGQLAEKSGFSVPA